MTDLARENGQTVAAVDAAKHERREKAKKRTKREISWSGIDPPFTIPEYSFLSNYFFLALQQFSQA